MKTYLRTLPVGLSRDEVLERAAQLGNTMGDLAVHEEAEKSRKASAKEKADKLTAEIKRLGEVVRNKSEPREVDCHEEVMLDEGLARVIRDDTGQLVETRALSEHEIREARQANLPGVVVLDVEAGKRLREGRKP